VRPILLGFILGLILVSCASMPQKLNDNVFYRRDLKMEINGNKGIGVMVVPYAPSYDFKVKSPGKMSLFTYATCHKNIPIEDGGKGWYKNKIEFTFTPDREIEASKKACPMEIGTWELGRGRNSWGFVDFETPHLKLPALLKCNGQRMQTNGVSVCQSLQGLIQEISFPAEVLTSDKSRCDKMTTKDNKLFRYKCNNRQCVYTFMERSKAGRMHRHTTICYEELLLRED